MSACLNCHGTGLLGHRMTANGAEEVVCSWCNGTGNGPAPLKVGDWVEWAGAVDLPLIPRRPLLRGNVYRVVYVDPHYHARVRLEGIHDLMSARNLKVIEAVG